MVANNITKTGKCHINGLSTSPEAAAKLAITAAHMAAEAIAAALNDRPRVFFELQGLIGGDTVSLQSNAEPASILYGFEQYEVTQRISGNMDASVLRTYVEPMCLALIQVVRDYPFVVTAGLPVGSYPPTSFAKAQHAGFGLRAIVAPDPDALGWLLTIDALIGKAQRDCASAFYGNRSPAQGGKS